MGLSPPPPSKFTVGNIYDSDSEGSHRPPTPGQNKISHNSNRGKFNSSLHHDKYEPKLESKHEPKIDIRIKSEMQLEERRSSNSKKREDRLRKEQSMISPSEIINAASPISSTGSPREVIPNYNISSMVENMKEDPEIRDSESGVTADVFR